MLKFSQNDATYDLSSKILQSQQGDSSIHIRDGLRPSQLADRESLLDLEMSDLDARDISSSVSSERSLKAVIKALSNCRVTK